MARLARFLVTTLILVFVPLIALASAPVGAEDGAVRATDSRTASGATMRWIALASESEVSCDETSLEPSALPVVPAAFATLGPHPGRATSMARCVRRPDLRPPLYRLPLRTSSAADADPH